MTLLRDLTGQRFGRLVAMSRIAGAGPVKWSAKCDCGQTAEVVTDSLTGGRTRSCGCLRKETAGRMNLQHGGARRGQSLPEFEVWKTMIRRCTNPDAKAYRNYGARGISVDPRWLRFEDFFADMGPRPSHKHSIERKNNDGPYAPGNCIWALRKVQARNTRVNRMIDGPDGRVTLAESAERLGINYHTLRSRLRRGWSEQRAATTPLSSQGRH